MIINFVKKRFYFLHLLIFVGIFASCSPEYIPNMVNSPVFSNKGEFQGTVATGTSNFDALLGYAITDNIAVIANGSFANESNDTTDEFHKHAIIEGGAGYYKKISSIARMEVFGGYGVGKIQTLEDVGFITDDKVDVTFNRIFIQPGIGAATDFFDGSFVTRVAFVQMKPGESQVISESWNTFIEPVITAKFGYKYVKAVVQFGYSFPLNDYIDYDHQRLIFNFGLNINIGRDYL